MSAWRQAGDPALAVDARLEALLRRLPARIDYRRRPLEPPGAPAETGTEDRARALVFARALKPREEICR